MSPRDVLIYDPEGGIADGLKSFANGEWRFRHARDLDTAIQLQQDKPALVGIVVMESDVASLPTALPQLTDSTVSEWIALISPDMLENTKLRPCIVQHFHDFHTLPADNERLLMTLGHAYGKANMRSQMYSHDEPGSRFGMIGQSRVMQTLYSQLEKVVKVDVPVLLSGESGAGKELVARAIHDYSARAAGPFVAMNCAAVPASLIQSELFGHEKGAFTGAAQRKIGNIEASENGVLFLDEIGDLSLDLQTNLLRFLQDMNIVRLGGTRNIPVNTRVVAASNVDLTAAVADDRFRADLFYRLNVVHIHVPALRDRRDDIRLLARAIFDNNLSIKTPRLMNFSESALVAMEQYNWPGNVRELINRVRRAMIMCEGAQIMPDDLGLTSGRPSDDFTTLEGARTKLDRQIILNSLEHNRCNISKSARELGVSRGTLYRMMTRLGIHNPNPPAANQVAESADLD